MVSFNPGPSQPYPEIRQYLQDAWEQQILSLPHRSPRFQEIYASACQYLSTKLEIPDGYRLLFYGSATECWSAIAEGAVRHASAHLHTGSFGERWMDYTRSLCPASFGLALSTETDFAAFDWSRLAGADLLALTPCETSNASRLPQSALQAAWEAFPDALIAADVTSSLAGERLELGLADIWFASVQKCFGLPPGLAVMLVSPRAQERIQELGDNGRHNGLFRVLRKAEAWETNFTPNTLNIYLLSRVAEAMTPISETEILLANRLDNHFSAVLENPRLDLLIHRPENRALTVVGVKTAPAAAIEFRKKASETGLYIGSGYGLLRETTFRIANFPAIPAAAVGRLLEFIRQF